MHPPRLKLVFLILVCSQLLCSCSNVAVGADKEAKASAKISNAEGSRFQGWDFLAKHLIQAGIDPKLVFKVLNDKDFPQFTFVPFGLSPKETTQMYSSMTANERLDRAESFLKKHKKEFEAAEARFGVTRYIIAGIISIETNWGKFTGNEQVLYRLARIVSTGESENVVANYKRLKSDDPSVELTKVEERSRYLFKTFFPHVLALFHQYKDSPNSMLKLKGSIAGAFGLPQFLPKSLEDYGVDGNKDKVVDLFLAEDAIPSVANFLKQHGWKKLLSPQDKLAVLWHYNRSDAYGRAVIRVALSLQNRDLKLN